MTATAAAADGDGDRDDAVARLRYVAGAAAYLLCQCTDVREVSEHLLCTCRIDGAVVHPQYWDGKRFCGVSAETPPYLSFFGSATFGYVVPSWGPGRGAANGGAGE